MPDDLGISGAVFADAGSLWGASVSGAAAQGCDRGNSDDGLPGRQLGDPLVGRRQLDVGLAGRSDPHGLRARSSRKETYDEEQFFRFGAATKF